MIERLSGSLGAWKFSAENSNAGEEDAEEDAGDDEGDGADEGNDEENKRRKEAGANTSRLRTVEDQPCVRRLGWRTHRSIIELKDTSCMITASKLGIRKNMIMRADQPRVNG